MDALEERAVLAVGGEDVNAVLLGQGQDEGPAGNEGLLVREADVLAGFDGSDRGLESGAADDSRDGGLDRGEGSDLAHALDPGDDLRGVPAQVGLGRAERLLELRDLGLLYGNKLGLEFLDLVHQELDVAPRAQGLDLEALRVLPTDVQRLSSDRARAPKNGDGLLLANASAREREEGKRRGTTRSSSSAKGDPRQARPRNRSRRVRLPWASFSSCSLRGEQRFRATQRARRRLRFPRRRS